MSILHYEFDAANPNGDKEAVIYPNIPTPINKLSANETNNIRDKLNEIIDVVDDGTFLNSPAFTGIPTAPTAPQGTSTTQIATTEFVNKEILFRLIKNRPYYYPSWYTGIRIPLSVKNGNAQYNYDVSSNIDLSSYTPYFISPTGVDANDGLTELTPKLTVTAAITAGARLIYMMPGTYNRNTFYGTVFNPGGDLIIIGIGEVNVTSTQTGLSWTLTTSNTYVAVRTQVSNVLDFKFKNKYGFYSALKQVTSQALCEAEAGTYYTNDASVWVHTTDGRVPDTNLKVQIYINSYIASNVGKIYFENIDFYDFEVRAEGTSNASALEVYMKDINVPVTKKPRITLSFEYNSFRFEGFKKAVLQNCTGVESTEDIFNYHNVLVVPNSSVMELECKAYSAGLNSPSASNQCSSIHEDLTILRINGNYFGGNNQVIADVGNSQSILVGCELNTESGQPNGVIFSGVNAELFGCKLFGNKIIKEEGGTHAVTVYNTIAEYSSTIGNVIIL